MTTENNDKSWKELTGKFNAMKKSGISFLVNTKDDDTRILKERAKAIATEEPKENEREEFISIIEFELGQEKYAFETQFLKEVASTKKIQDLPGTPDFIFGVINLSGKIATVIDLKKYLNLKYVGFNDNTSIIVVDYKGTPVGFVADAINGIKSIRKSSVQNNNPILQKIKDIFLLGISDEAVIVLDIIKLLDEDNIQVDNRF